MYKKLLNALMFSLLALVLSFGVSYVSAWTAPTQAPPAGNTNPPINTSATTQSKAGTLSVGGLVLPAGGIVDSGGAYATYGAATIRGTKNSFGGVNFRDSSNNNLGTLMMRSDYSGFYNAAENNWRWYATEGGNTYQPGYVQAGGLVLPAGGIIDSGGSAGVYGAATIRGTKNGWGGVNFRDSSNNNQGTLMMHSGYSGFHNAAETNWRWYATEGGNTYQPGYVQASDVYAGGRWMSSIVSDTGPDSGTLCGWQATKENTLVLCKGYRPIYDGCPPGYTLNVIDAATWPQYFCSKN